ncbi:MAG TPA: hypothetical protein VHM24_06520, partial [Gemmatimonadaceae bacterium]|nr:hypothetical protein [Gemmatimonadaceae bacterium]
EFIAGEGKLVRGGGRVVKNVAGFDLVRLITGSWGTLGVISEVTLRLYSTSSQPVTLALNLPVGTGGVAQRIAAILNGPATPFAVEMLDSATAAQIGLPGKTQVLVRIGGNAAAVQAQRDALGKLGGAHEVPPEVWGQLRLIEGAGTMKDEPPVVIRLSTLPGHVAELWTAVQGTMERIAGAMMHATPSLGIVRCILPASAVDCSACHALAASIGGVTTVYERLPSVMWTELSPSVTSDRLSRSVKHAFDPGNILNPGILGNLT